MRPYATRLRATLTALLALATLGTAFADPLEGASPLPFPPPGARPGSNGLPLGLPSVTQGSVPENVPFAWPSTAPNQTTIVPRTIMVPRTTPPVSRLDEPIAKDAARARLLFSPLPFSEKWIDPTGGQVKSDAPAVAAPPSTAPNRSPLQFDPAASGKLWTAEAPIAPRVVLYEEVPDDPTGKRSVGSVTWRTETISPDTGKPPELAVRADIEIPERKISITWTLRRDNESNGSISHDIEILFKLPPDFPSGGISSVPGMWMKEAEQTRGSALAGTAVKVTTGYFLIGLSNAPSDRERNIQLLKARPWFDIPIVYTNNRRAILAMEKGTPGQRAFAGAFAAWGVALSEAPPSPALPGPIENAPATPFPPPGTRRGAIGSLPPGATNGSPPANVPIAETAQGVPPALGGGEASDRDDCVDDAQNPAQTIASCSRVIANNTADASKLAHAYRSRATAYYKKGDFDQAIDDFSEAIKLNSNSAELYKDRGNAYRDKKDDDRAIADFDQAIKLDPNYTLAYNNRGAAYNRKNDPDRAIADLDQAIKLDPNYAFAYNNRGNAYLRKANYDLAIADYSEAIKRNPSYAIAYDNRGLAYFRKNDLDRAIADYGEAIRLNPRLASPYTHRCNAYYSTKTYDSAITDCGEAIRLNPKDDFARSTLGFANAATAKRDYEAAVPVMNRLSINLPMNVAGVAPVKKSLDALNREPCDQQAILDLGLALDKAGRKREAANAQLNFSAACGGYAPALKAAANLLLSLADYDGAATAASALIKMDSHSDGGFYLRAVAYDRGGSTKKAIDDYLTAIELAGSKVNISIDTYLAVARNYEKLGQFCDARSIIEAWVALNPARNDSDRMQAIIADYAALGKCDAANGRGEEVFRIPPNSNIIRLPVVINGVRGTFMMDTGATFVSMKSAFAEKAKVQIDQDSNLKMHTANGVVDGKRGRAAIIQLRSLQAKDVAVVVQNTLTLAEGVDGLLGLSFLSRFAVSIDAQTVRIANRHAK